MVFGAAGPLHQSGGIAAGREMLSWRSFWTLRVQTHTEKGAWRLSAALVCESVRGMGAGSAPMICCTMPSRSAGCWLMPRIYLSTIWRCCCYSAIYR